MFNDARGKKIIFVAHCILNQNSISDGTAVYPGSIQQLIKLIVDSDIGIVQMPCPELMCLGLDRGNVEGGKSPVVEENTRIRTQMRKQLMQEKINQLVQNLVFQIAEYKKYGFQIVGIVGMNRSPSCGVDTTSDHNKETRGHGLFIGSLKKALQDSQIPINVIGIKASEIDLALSAVKGLIASY